MLLIKRPLLGVGLLALFLALPFLTPYHSLATEMIVFALFALGYDIVFGYTGLLSFGHAIFFGTGAYGMGLVLTKLAPNLFVGFLAGLAINLLLSLAIGFLTIRRRGIYFVMVTLAFCQMFYFIGFKWSSLTGGDNGLHGVPRPLLGPLDLNNELVFYYCVLALFIVCVAAAYRIIHSPFGRVLEALRENEDRAKSIGYNTTRYKIIAFILSAGFASLAGGVYALHLNFVPLSTLSILTAGDVVIMSLVGGIGTLYGPVFGAMLIVYLKDILSGWIENWNMIMAVLFMSSVLLFRKGIFPGIVEKLPWRRNVK